MIGHGIEQEFQICAASGILVPRVKEILQHIPSANLGKGGIYKDKYATQLEISTDVFYDIDELRCQLLELRETVCQAARKAEVNLIAAGANPLSSYRVGEFFSEHHHIDAKEAHEKVLLNNFFRIFVPHLFAISVNSPIVARRITRFKCFRASGDVNRRPNPNIKPPPYITIQDIERGHLENYDRKRSRYFDVTSFTKECRITGVYKPTVEVRLFDMQPSIPITIAYASIIQALALKAMRSKVAPDAKIHSNREAAIEKGLHARFMSAGFDDLSWNQWIYAYEAWERLLKWLLPELKELGMEGCIAPLHRMIHERKTLADIQISLYTGEPESFISEMVKLTMEEYEKEPLPKRKFVLVDEETLENIRREKHELEGIIESIKSFCRRAHSIDVKALTSAITAMAKHHVTDDEWFSEQLRMIYRLQDAEGCVGGSIFKTALFLEALCACKLSTELSAFASREVDRRFEASLRWILSNRDWKDEIWLNSYILRVLNEAGVREENVKEKLDWLEKKMREDGSFEGKIWVTSFALRALASYGRDTKRTVEWILSKKINSHWQEEGVDSLLLTSLVLLALKDAGSSAEDARSWLSKEANDIPIHDWKDVYKVSMILQSLA